MVLKASLLLCRLADLAEGLEERGKRIGLIVGSLLCFPLPDNAQADQVFQFSLSRVQRKARFKHDLSLVKGSSGIGKKKIEDSGPGGRTE